MPSSRSTCWFTAASPSCSAAAGSLRQRSRWTEGRPAPRWHARWTDQTWPPAWNASSTLMLWTPSEISWPARRSQVDAL